MRTIYTSETLDFLKELHRIGIYYGLQIAKKSHLGRFLNYSPQKTHNKIKQLYEYGLVNYDTDGKRKYYYLTVTGKIFVQNLDEYLKKKEELEYLFKKIAFVQKKQLK